MKECRHRPRMSARHCLSAAARSWPAARVASRRRWSNPRASNDQVRRSRHYLHVILSEAKDLMAVASGDEVHRYAQDDNGFCLANPLEVPPVLDAALDVLLGAVAHAEQVVLAHLAHRLGRRAEDDRAGGKALVLDDDGACDCPAVLS